MPNVKVSHDNDGLDSVNLNRESPLSASKSPPRSSNTPFPPVTAPRTNNSQELNNTAKVVSPDTEEDSNDTKITKLARSTSPMYSPLRPPIKGKRFYSHTAMQLNHLFVSRKRG
eukprot:scaffold3040_cov225-Chaetoceros_neogracile.AAC.5